MQYPVGQRTTRPLCATPRSEVYNRPSMRATGEAEIWGSLDVRIPCTELCTLHGISEVLNVKARGGQTYCMDDDSAITALQQPTRFVDSSIRIRIHFCRETANLAADLTHGTSAG